MQRKILVCLFCLSLLLNITLLNQGQSVSNPVFSAGRPLPLATQFKQIDQPMLLKLAVTLGGAALIGLELWWFLGSKPKA